MFNLSVDDIINASFNITVFSILFSIALIYFISYLLSLLAYGKRDEETLLSGRGLILNIILFPALLYGIFTFGGNATFDDTIIQLQSFLNNPSSIFSVLSFIVGFYSIIYILGIPMTNAMKPSSIACIDIMVWLLFIIVLICDFFSIFLNVSLSNKVLGNILNKALNDASINMIDTSLNNEVFNISNNLYSYTDAEEVCSIYGAKLATYDQVEQAYNRGGEWCNYGWSDGQMALFPTQKSTWSKLQKSKTTKNNCGRPGVNGGYMENKELMFGVNCFGKKPKATESELKKMEANRKISVVENPEDKVRQAKLNFLKDNKDTLLVVNSFNRNYWSEL
jgi:hypothetical protein